MIQYECIPIILMKVKRDNNIIDLVTINEPIFCVTLDSLKTEKALNYHDTFLLWQKSFDMFHIPVYIITPNSQKELEQIKRMYRSNIEYVQDIDAFQDLGSLTNKIVYGKKYKIIKSAMYIIVNGKVIDSSKRIHNKSIKNLYIKVIDCKTKIFLKNLKNSIDIPPNLW